MSGLASAAAADLSLTGTNFTLVVVVAAITATTMTRVWLEPLSDRSAAAADARPDIPSSLMVA